MGSNLKKLKKRVGPLPLVGVPPEVRSAIAEAVDGMIRSTIDQPGVLPINCLMYAVVGGSAITALTGHRTVVQVGSLAIHTYTDEVGPLCAGYDAERGGIQKQEFHAWIGLPGLNQLVDLASRNYPQMCDHVVEYTRDERMRWPADREAPPFIWTEPDGLPEWMTLDPIRSETDFFYANYETIVDPTWLENLDGIVEAAKALLRGVDVAWKVEGSA